MADEKKTIKEELEELGIASAPFDNFYRKLKEDKQLPSEADFPNLPAGQYKTIVDYLTGKKVLDKDGKIQEDDLVVFEAEKKLEDEIEEVKKGGHLLKRRHRNTGGVRPCQRYGRARGGIRPCRY